MVLIPFFFLFFSLIVTTEIVKFGQALLVNNDIDMYYEENDTPARARTSTLIEELGQVQYIFSDKTGTLTENKMVFQKASIAGRNYYDETKVTPPKLARKESAYSNQTSEIELQSFHNPMVENGNGSSSHGNGNGNGNGADEPPAQLDSFNLLRGRLVDRTPDAATIHEFFTLLSVCHTVIPEFKESAPNGMVFFFLF